MVELLTRRHTYGWVSDGRDSTLPVTLRVRDSDLIIAQLTFETPKIPEGSIASPIRSEHRFYLEFPFLLDFNQMMRLTIEASCPGLQDWRPIQRHLRVRQPEADFPPPGKWEKYSKDPTEAGLVSLPYWSEDKHPSFFDSTPMYPVFILGAARSGTSAICLALEKGSRYQGFAEGHVFDVAIRLINAVHAHFDWKSPWITPEILAGYHLGRIDYSQFHDTVLEMLKSLALGFTSPYWIDKTPTYQMIASVPILAQAWPNAKFVFMKRRGLEVIRSRSRKFAAMQFQNACNDWSLIMSGWRTVRDMIPARFLEVDQYHMATNPEQTANNLGKLLHLDSTEITAIAHQLRKQRPESTGPADNIVSDPAELKWNPEQMNMFLEKCGREMVEYGYAYDSSYCKQRTKDA